MKKTNEIKVAEKEMKEVILECKSLKEKLNDLEKEIKSFLAELEQLDKEINEGKKKKKL